MKMKKKSKRVACSKKYKIEKKVRDHNKKQRRDAKKKGSGNHKHSKKDPGIPNCYPFKEELLKEMSEKKEQDKELKAEKRRQQQKERQQIKRDEIVMKNRNLTDLVTQAESKQQEFDLKPEDNETQVKMTKDMSRKAFYKEFKKVVDQADVVIEVLDARDPFASRCTQLEQDVVKSGDKKLILLLNKVDLVPKENVEKWLKYLRNEFPTLPFKATQQLQRKNLGQSKVRISFARKNLLTSSKCLGADMLIQLLANYSRNCNIKTSITVGIVGFPNVGKSSVINSLKRARSCNVGALPGMTRTLQEVHLDNRVKLLDSPGIVLATHVPPSELVLRNFVNVSNLRDVETPVSHILKRCSQKQIMQHYHIPAFSGPDEFLAHMAKRFGLLRKGGLPNIWKAAKTVLNDWNSGNITYYSEPPEINFSQGSSEIVNAWSKAFDLTSLLQNEDKTLEALRPKRKTQMETESMGPVATDLARLTAEFSNSMDTNDSHSTKTTSLPGELSEVTVGFRTGSKQNPAEKTETEDSATSLEGNQQLGKNSKKDAKKRKKLFNRRDKLSTTLSDSMESAFNFLGAPTVTSEKYDFNTDYV